MESGLAGGPAYTSAAQRTGQRIPAQRAAATGHAFRGDVEGLRALAIAGVMSYHAGVDDLSGGYVGVDVFFVVSGFLITGLLLRELEGQGTIALLRFYGRRMRRLLPLTAVVLVSVVLLSWLLYSPVERRSVYGDVMAAAMYVLNWRQQAQAVDYSALHAMASPLQHFWSLAVEEQFYLVWPLALLAVARLCRGRRHLRRHLGVVLGLLAAASLLYSVVLTQRDASAAYFSTFTRGWELAAGGLLALVPAAWWGRLPRRVPGALGLAGLAAVLGAMLAFSDDTSFPGAAALLPVLGTAAIIGAGSASGAGNPVGRLLSLRPVRYVGRISYSWYLWHWPAIVFATVWLSGLSTPLLLLVVALSWIPAALTHRLVEERFRRAPAFAPTGAAMRLGTACTATSVALGAVAWAAVPVVPLAGAGQVAGAAALNKDGPFPQRSADALRPVPRDATQDKGRAHDAGCLVSKRATTSGDCVFGDPSSSTTAVLFGDSHAIQYAPAMDRIAKRHGWRLVVLTKSGCTPAEVSTFDPQLRREYSECDTWRSRALKRIEKAEPALVVTGNRATTRTVGPDGKMNAGDSAAALRDGYVKTLRRLEQTGAQVVTIADNPHPREDVPACVSKSMDDLPACSFDEDHGLYFERVGREAAAKVPGVHLVDPTPVLCQDGTCPAVIGNALVYRNGAHLTATYAGTLTDWLDDRLPDDV